MEYKVNHELCTIGDSGMNKRCREREGEREKVGGESNAHQETDGL